MVEYVVHHMYFDLELNKIEDVGYHPKFQEKLMKDGKDDKEYFF